jgi:hypothetical protein
MHEIADAAFVVMIGLIVGAFCFVAAAIFLTILETFRGMKRKGQAKPTAESLDPTGQWVDNRDASRRRTYSKGLSPRRSKA